MKSAFSFPASEQTLSFHEHVRSLPSRSHLKSNLKAGVMLCCVAGAIGMMTGAAHADDFTWTGANAEWTNPASWTRTSGTTRTFPNNTVDTATFNVATEPAVTVASAVTVNKITSGTSDATTRSISGSTITLGGTTPTIDVASGKTLTINNVLPGISSLTKTSAGTLTLSGVNTYTGATIVNGGTLKAGVASIGTTSGPFGSNSTVNILPAASFFNQTTTSGTNQVTLTSAPTGVVVGQTVVGTTNFPAGTTVTAISGNTITFSANATATSSTQTLRFVTTGGAGAAILDITGFDTTIGSLNGGRGEVNNSGGSVTLGSNTLTTGGNNAGAVYAGVISGTGGLIKNGTGQQELANANTYTGPTLINAGTLQLGSNTPFGALSPSSTITNNGTFAINRTSGGPFVQGTTFSGAPITGSGSVFITNGALTLNALNTYTGGTNIGGFGTVNAISIGGPGVPASNLGGPTGAIIFSGLNSAAVNLNYTGTGETTERPLTFTMQGSGGPSLNQLGTGLLKFTGAITAPAGANKTLNLTGSTAGTGELSSGIPNANGATSTITPASNSFAAGTNPSTITFSGNATGFAVGQTVTGTNIPTGTTITAVSGTTTPTVTTTITLSQQLTGAPGNVTATGTFLTSVVKNGTGTWTLSGANTYTGTTAINGGTLTVNGSTSTGAVTVSSGATLAGTGTVGGTTTVATTGIHAPGVSGPGIQNTGNYTLSSGSTLKADITSTVAGTGYDQVNVVGTVTLGGNLTVTSTGFTPTSGASIVLINNDGTDAVTGVFANQAEGSTVTLGGAAYTLSYVGNSSGAGVGNDVVLTPPSTGVTSGVLISQFRLSGPSGLSDEFIELVNTTNASANLTGVKLQAGSVDVVDLSGKSIPAGGHLLITNSTGYSLDGTQGALPGHPSGTGTGSTTGDAFYTGGIASDAVLTLVSGASTLDSVNTTGALTNSSTAQYAFVRRVDAGAPADSGTDSDDFNLVDVASSAGVDSQSGTGPLSGARLGAPGPRNTLSPIQRNALIGIAPLSIPGVASDARMNSTGSAIDPLGRLSLRRTLTNKSQTVTMTRLRFRITAITAGTNTTASDGTGTADVRAISSSNVGVRYRDSGNNLLTAALGLALEVPSSPTAPLAGGGAATPPAGAQGGGQNSSWSIVNFPAGGIAPNGTLNVEFLLGIVKDGNFRVAVDAELLP